MNIVIEVAGWSATIVLLVAYALLSRGRLSGQETRYQGLNVVGSALVGLNSLAHGAWPSVSINAIWLLIGVATLMAALRRHLRARCGVTVAADLSERGAHAAV